MPPAETLGSVRPLEDGARPPARKYTLLAEPLLSSVLVRPPRYLQCRREDCANSCASQHERRAIGCPHEMEPDILSAER